ncbi:MAG TPA: arsenate reductase ArsC [Burkholderiaceae bacterium]|nr:arsenate reductase ArsC [Burkholderiaceae bacterium]
MSDQRIFNVLFVCTSNSSRSILAEAILNGMRNHQFRAYSAGSHPKGEVSPNAIKILQENRYPTEGLRSKDWSEFAGPDAPALDFVFTVCDKAAGEVCPVWPGQPLTAHWGVEEPTVKPGENKTVEQKYLEAATVLRRRIELLLALPIDKLDRLALQKSLAEIGQTR